MTLEISNTTPLPARVYSNEGLCQIVFFQSDEVAWPENSGWAVAAKSEDAVEGLLSGVHLGEGCLGGGRPPERGVERRDYPLVVK